MTRPDAASIKSIKNNFLWIKLKNRDSGMLQNFTGTQIDSFLKRKYPDMHVENLQNYC